MVGSARDWPIYFMRCATTVPSVWLAVGAASGLSATLKCPIVATDGGTQRTGPDRHVQPFGVRAPESRYTLRANSRIVQQAPAETGRTSLPAGSPYRAEERR